jgi:choline-sulfatase
VTFFDSLRSRSWRAARWLAPSVATACAGALAGGAVEGAWVGDALGGVAAAGFFALLAVPLLVIASVSARGLWLAWRPAELGLVEDGGGAPRLAAWLLVIVFGSLALAWAMFQGTWLLERWTTFKPLPVSYGEPMIAIVATLTIVLVSRPVVRVLTFVLRKLDARRRRRARKTLLAPLRVVLATGVLAIIVAVVIWFVVVLPRVGTLAIAPLAAAALAMVATAFAHAALRGPRSRLVGGTLVGATVGAIAVALVAWQARPALVLAIWGDRPLAGLAVDTLFDLDAIRDRLPAAAMRPVDKPGAAHPDILLITIDTVRADHTPPYGGRADMPTLKDLGTRGAVFDWAFSPSNVTRRSIPSMVIGVAPNRVHGRVVGWALRVDPRHVLVAERLRAGGYETAGFMCCGGIWGKDARTGLSRGLDYLELEPHENGVTLAKRARAWLEAREQRHPDRPLFMWMHILEPHNWHQTSGTPHSPDEARRFYDQTLTLSDGMLAQVLAAFSARDSAHAPIVIVTADHGEALGDHGQPYHSTDLYDSQIHVPLVIAGPNIPARHVNETVSLTDLTPTLVELAGFVPPTGPDIDGRSFADLALGQRSGQGEGGTAFAAMIKDRSNPGGIVAVVRGRDKLIDTGSSLELYDVHADPDERSDLIMAKANLAESLKGLLKSLVDKGKQSPF